MTASPERQREARLAQAERHIRGTEGRILHQELLIRRLADLGADTAQAEQLLRSMRQSLELSRHHRAVILGEAP
jgi:hypothetical protein